MGSNINLHGLFNAKAILVEQHQRYYLTDNWRDKRVHAFPKSISPKVNVIARLEFELAYSEVAILNVNHYTTESLVYFRMEVNSGKEADSSITLSTN